MDDNEKFSVIFVFYYMYCVFLIVCCCWLKSDDVNVHICVKPQALSLFGAIALAVRGVIAPHSRLILNLLVCASQLTIDQVLKEVCL